MSWHRKAYLLDTNICIFYMKGLYGIPAKIHEAGLENCYISEITLAELYYGAANSGRKAKKIEEVRKLERLFEPLPIRPCLEAYGDAKADLRSRGITIEDFDLLIGATAVANGMVMVTENVRHLSRIGGITLENWVSR